MPRGMGRGYGRRFNGPYPGYRFSPFGSFYGLIDIILLILMIYVLFKLFLVGSVYVVALVILWIIRRALRPSWGFFGPW
ncbi:hypothetical protein X802_07500 [Thermococcus guaymasensis DSM 11113]|uniref:Uncharacterized protein n=1 Tax=Thermococcus guaymasensis DSM 11113 TaxID=1432656 RepID=A0A0X1KL70_9EURY|nr:hypothetical protein [Thermococcus guaymasensis]AJC72021.1 hypothetical protein X802_07500 [Thermococcus guaymasensis DSM 11113]